MSTIEQNLIGNTAGLSRVDKVLRYFFFALLIGTVVYSIGGTFFGRANRLNDYGSSLPWRSSLLRCQDIRARFPAFILSFGPASGR